MGSARSAPRRRFRETTERREVHPTPSVWSCAKWVHGRLGRVAEWLKAHDWKSCGQCPRGFESHPVRFLKSSQVRTHESFEEARRVGSSRATEWVVREAPRAVTRETSERSEVHPTPSVVATRWFRGVAQSGRALRSGRRGPRFESGRPDCLTAGKPRTTGALGRQHPLLVLLHDLINLRRAWVSRSPATPAPGCLERWQNGIALASKASARKGLGVRIPRAPSSPSRSLAWGAF